MDDLVEAALNYGLIQEQAGALEEYVEIARALRSGEPGSWQGMSREVIQHLMAGMTRWARKESRDIPVPAPELVRIAGGLSAWTRLHLSDLLLWALTGTFSEEERKALAVRT